MLLPFVLAAGGYWRAFAAAAVTVLACIALTLSVWGWPVWQAFFNSIHSTRTIVFESGDTGFRKFQSAFTWVRSLGGSLTVAYGLQAIVTAGVLILCTRIWRGAADLRLKGATLLVGALLSNSLRARLRLHRAGNGYRAAGIVRLGLWIQAVGQNPPGTCMVHASRGAANCEDDLSADWPSYPRRTFCGSHARHARLRHCETAGHGGVTPP